MTSGVLVIDNKAFIAEISASSSATSYGYYVDSLQGAVEWGYYNNDASSNNFMGKDNVKDFQGTGQDASVYYDGVNMIINPKEVGIGYLGILGNLNVTNNITLGSVGNAGCISVRDTDDAGWSKLQMLNGAIINSTGQC